MKTAIKLGKDRYAQSKDINDGTKECGKSKGRKRKGCSETNMNRKGKK